MRIRSAALCLFLAGQSTVALSQSPTLGNYNAISGARLKAHLEFIANDLLEGRDTPSRGLDIAAQYIAAQLKLWGVEPGANGSYFQKFPVRQLRISEGSTLEFEGTKYAVFQDFLPSFSKGNATGNLVFVGSGYRIPSLKIDPYKDVDVRGKIVVHTAPAPKSWNWQLFYEGKLPGAETPDMAAISHGAVGIIVIRDPSQDANWNMISQQTRDLRIPLVGESNFGGAIPTVTASAKLVDRLFAKENRDLAKILAEASNDTGTPSFAFSEDKRLSMNVQVAETKQFTQNVVGVIRGSDPKLKSEYLAIGAHYDHVGMREGDGDRIFNGADDDGSGTVSVLELAHAFATGARPKRSIIFVWHAGEEKGLWGSDFFTNNPTVPRKDIVAQLNIDMIGRSRPAGNTDPRNSMLTGPDGIYVIGSRKLSSELGNICEAVNKSLYKLTFDYHYDAPNDPEQMYQRSDHYNYARFNIPIAFFFDGVHEDYHQVSDQVEKIDFRKMERVARTVFGIGWRLATQSNRPKLDTPKS